MWAPQIAALSPHYRVIALDLWGHGESGRLPENTRSLDDIARQAQALLDHLNIDQVTLVGLSVGGMWGVRLALTAPQRINGLVLMDTYVGVEPEPTRQYYFSLFKQIEETGEISEQLLDIVVPIFFRPGIDPQSALYQDFRAKLAAYSSDRLRESIVPMGRITFGRDDLLPCLGELSAATTLVLCGDQDKPRPPSEAQEMAARGCWCRRRGISPIWRIPSLSRRCCSPSWLSAIEKIAACDSPCRSCRRLRSFDLAYLGPRICASLSGDGAPCCCCSSPLASM
jgi:pimeloyl-ACP methyl ester carboxylesterase